MHVRVRNHGRLRQIEIFFSISLFISTFIAPAALATSAHKRSGLSLSNITLLAGESTSETPFWAAIQQGFFKKYGVTVTWLNSGGAAAAAEITVVLTGTAQFIDVAPQSLISAVASGAPFRAVAALGVGNGNQLGISTAAAAQFHVAQTANTVAGIKAQFLALKGSHIVIAASTTTSSAYECLYALAVKYGLTVSLGSGGTSADIYLSTDGSPANEEAAFNTGKVGGLVGTPPTTVQPGVVAINIGKLPPFSVEASNYMATTVSMIQQHPDTVQAMVDGLTQGISWTETHPTAGEKILSYYDANFGGITSPEEVEYLYADETYEWQYSTFPTRQAYQLVLETSNLSQPPPIITLPYSTWVVTKYAEKALKTIPGLYKWRQA